MLCFTSCLCALPWFVSLVSDYPPVWYRSLISATFVYINEIKEGNHLLIYLRTYWAALSDLETCSILISNSLMSSTNTSCLCWQLLPHQVVLDGRALSLQAGISAVSGTNSTSSSELSSCLSLVLCCLVLWLDSSRCFNLDTSVSLHWCLVKSGPDSCLESPLQQVKISNHREQTVPDTKRSNCAVFLTSCEVEGWRLCV